MKDSTENQKIAGEKNNLTVPGDGESGRQSELFPFSEIRRNLQDLKRKIILGALKSNVKEDGESQFIGSL